MKTKMLKKKEQKERRRKRGMACFSGTPERPRLNVYRSLKGVYIQLIDDVNGKTLVSVDSKEDIKKGEAGNRKSKEAEAYWLGRALADRAKQAGISRVVFDRAGNKYHGRVKAVAEGARDGGLVF